MQNSELENTVTEEVEEKTAEVIEEKAAEVTEEKEVEEEKAAEVTESMEDYAEELEASYRRIRSGDIVTGTVIDVNEKDVTVDFNYYAPGRIPAEDMSSDPNFNILTDVKVGDTISATVVKTDDGTGNLLLSKKEATDELAWDKLKEMMENRTVVHGKIGGIVNSGVIMYVEGIRGFIPASKLDLKYVEDTNEYLNKEVDAIIITVEAAAKKLVLSVRDVLQEKAIEEKNKKIQKIQVGVVVEGRVEQLKDYGAFVDIGDGISGLLHISQISERRIKHPSQVLKEGDTVKVKITRINDNKISLSMKEANELVNKEVEEVFNYKESGSAFTGLGDLLKGIKLDK